MRAITLCWIGIVLCAGCAQKPVQRSKNLTQLYFQRLNRNKVQERFNFENVLKSARRYEDVAMTRKFHLPTPLNEESLYTDVVKSYQLREIDALNYYVSQFVYRFPQSVFADSALYLRGEMYLIMGMTPRALRDFQKILTDYPEGKKYAAALYGKAVCYQRLGLYHYSEEVLQQLRREFPGSPQILKAAMEQKILQAERSTNSVQE